MNRIQPLRYTRRDLLAAVAAGLATMLLSLAANAQVRPCSFSGPDVEQAKCLLRPVKRYAELGPPRTSLPAPLDRLVGQPAAAPLKTALAAYLRAHGIREAEIGGKLSDPVSKTSGGEFAHYFIIHDTSSPVSAHNATFPPAGMDNAAWSGNQLAGHVASKHAHVFVNRAGQSATSVDFNTPWRSTKYEGQSSARKGLFLGIESIQPRRLDARGIDAEAPSPGFSDAQLDRLALLYVAASGRRGQWLVPAYHAAIDAGFRDAHDDPQNFDLDHWASRLDTLLADISGGSDAGPADGGATPAPTPPPACAASLPIAGASTITERFLGGGPMMRLRGGQIYFEADMDIDADGSPRARAIDPCAGCGQPRTSMRYPGVPGREVFVNAEDVPYVVLPGKFYRQFGVGLGDVAAVVYRGQVQYAIFADTGPSNKIGEGSIKLAQLFEHDPYVTRGGRRIIGRSIPSGVKYIIFPGTADPAATPENVIERTRAKGAELFAQLCNPR
jgi:hypothetical protein